MPSPPGLYQQGLQALQEGSWQRARSLFQRASQQQHSHGPAWQGLAIASLQLEQFADALKAAQQALSLNEAWPQASQALSEAHAGLGHQAADQAQWAEAARHFGEAVARRPDVGAWESNLAVAQLRLGRLDQALQHALKAVELLPYAADVHNTLATVLQEQLQLDAAARHYSIALELEPWHNQARSNLGTLHHQQGLFHEAERNYRAHLQRFPDDVRTRVNLAGTLLLQGEACEGWKHYETRLEQSSGIMQLPKGLKRWGGPHERCQQLVIVHEQGYGDAFQFLRYATLLRPYAPQLIYQGPQKLHSLILKSGLVDSCTPEGHGWTGRSRTQTRWEALLSLPMRLGATSAEPLCTEPYLKVLPERVAHWKEALAGNTPLIGLHWQGNPEHEITISRGRSLSLEALAPLAELDGVRFLSLQKGPGSEQLPGCSFARRFCTAQPLVDTTWDFAETAAILEACDLVITSDSGLAHLSGGLGRPTWILLMHIPEWRWGLTGEHTPWYPSAKLWRQSCRGDWDGVVQQLKPALQRWRDGYTGSNA